MIYNEGMHPVVQVSIKYQDTYVRNGSVDIYIYIYSNYPLNILYYTISPEDGHWSGPKHVVKVMKSNHALIFVANVGVSIFNKEMPLHV
jgi:hypothetical protein